MNPIVYLWNISNSCGEIKKYHIEIAGTAWTCNVVMTKIWGEMQNRDV
jgi:hypothetical protein